MEWLGVKNVMSGEEELGEEQVEELERITKKLQAIKGRRLTLYMTSWELTTLSRHRISYAS